MDVRQYSRVLKRFWGVVAIGVLTATILAVGSYYKPSSDGGMPPLEPRKEEVWQASATLFLTQKGFPAGRTEQPVIVRRVGNEEQAVAQYADPGRLASLAPLYARLANSDAVTRRMLKDGPLEGKAKAIPTADTSYGAVNGLPMISIFGTAPTQERALRVTKRAMEAFVAYLSDNQDAARITGDKRVLIEVVNAPGELLLISPRKKTLPIFVFLAVLCATIAVVFVLDNARTAVTVVQRPVRPSDGQDSRGVHGPAAPVHEEPATASVRKSRWA